MVFQNYALYPHMTVAENMAFSLKMAKVPEGRAHGARQGGGQAPRPHRVPRAQAQGALRWPAPARRHGPRDRPPAAGVLHGRAAVEPRRQAPGLDPHADRRAAAAPRRHDRLRHPRPGRGHDDGRPGRGAQGRHPAAGRHPAEPLRQARQPVRRRLHRLAGHEPAARAQRRRATPSSATSRCRSTATRPTKAHGDITVGVRPEYVAHRRRGRGHPGQGDRRRGARRGRLRLRHQRRGGHARPGDRPHRRATQPPQGRDALRHDRPASTCTCSTPTSGSVCPSNGRGAGRRTGACAS